MQATKAFDFLEKDDRKFLLAFDAIFPGLPLGLNTLIFYKSFSLRHLIEYLVQGQKAGTTQECWCATMQHYRSSIVNSVRIRGFKVHLKRDDLIKPLSGNKVCI